MENIQFYTVEEAAEILKLSRRTITRMIETKRMKAQNVGFGKERRFYRIPADEITKIRRGRTK